MYKKQLLLILISSLLLNACTKSDKSVHKFLGNYEYSIRLGGGLSVLGRGNCSISTASSGGKNIVINDLSMFNPISATVDSNGESFTIPSQSIGTNNIISGSGTINSNNILIDYIFSNTPNDIYHASLTRI